MAGAACRKSAICGSPRPPDAAATVSVTIGDRMVEGIFETLDDSGRLILRAADNSEIAIAAGEVHFGAAATRNPAKDHH